MLIRIYGHFLKNPRHIDKLIVIRGLPFNWMFRKRDDSKELISPWEPDIDANIPKHIRHLCTPTEILEYYPPIEKGKDGITDKRCILGVRINFMTEPGRDMWQRIERYIDDTLPRGTRMPEPVLVAKDQLSPFETYATKKSTSGGIYLEEAEIPVVDLTPEVAPPISLISPQVSQNVVSLPVQTSSPSSEPAGFKCKDCAYTSPKERAVRMHTMKAHGPKKQKVVA